jgi:hypothetical protein
MGMIEIVLIVLGLAFILLYYSFVLIRRLVCGKVDQNKLNRLNEKICEIDNEMNILKKNVPREPPTLEIPNIRKMFEYPKEIRDWANPMLPEQRHYERV